MNKLFLILLVFFPTICFSSKPDEARTEKEKQIVDESISIIFKNGYNPQKTLLEESIFSEEMDLEEIISKVKEIKKEYDTSYRKLRSWIDISEEAPYQILNISFCSQIENCLVLEYVYFLLFNTDEKIYKIETMRVYHTGSTIVQNDSNMCEYLETNLCFKKRSLSEQGLEADPIVHGNFENEPHK